MPVDVKVPEFGESITEAVIVSWLKPEGATVAVDEPIAELETDKANSELPAPAAGVLRILRQVGERVQVGEIIARIEQAGLRPVREAGSAPLRVAPAPPEARSSRTQAEARIPPVTELTPGEEPPGEEPVTSPAARRLVAENDLDASEIPGSGRGGRVMKEDVLRHLRRPDAGGPRTPDQAKKKAASAPRAVPSGASAAPQPPAGPRTDSPDEERAPMSSLRRRIAERLVQAQHTAAILTTFNEIDMMRVIDLRSRHKDSFAEKHGVSLGFMSFFARACVLALREVRGVNARIEGEEIVYNRRVHLGIATSTERGLVVPVVRNADAMSMADLEREIARLATVAREGKLSIADLSGGTFTISNGGVFGSLLSTPILNPPQSGILGMHKIEKRPVVVDDQIVIRPMMYVALSYDHRLIDGREAVTFLVRVKERLEDPERLLLDL
jgi:2-oxoglutarate dehydrogenase E2 component (dihydrolipoamide succinyltransferase)